MADQIHVHVCFFCGIPSAKSLASCTQLPPYPSFLISRSSSSRKMLFTARKSGEIQKERIRTSVHVLSLPDMTGNRYTAVVVNERNLKNPDEPLEVIEKDIPSPGAGEVLVRITLRPVSTSQALDIAIANPSAIYSDTQPHLTLLVYLYRSIRLMWHQVGRTLSTFLRAVLSGRSRERYADQLA